LLVPPNLTIVNRFRLSLAGGKLMEKVNVAEKFDQFNDYWSPKIAEELNDSYIKLAKFKGEFVWHHHEREDELFFVTKGRLLIRLRDREIAVGPGEFVVVPRGVEHLPVADDEVHVILIEPKTTLNTGNITNDRTVARLEKI
jgi:mannose-6-phosphate isomerase-like protein (cupin superfamily)